MHVPTHQELLAEVSGLLHQKHHAAPDPFDPEDPANDEFLDDWNAMLEFTADRWAKDAVAALLPWVRNDFDPEDPPVDAPEAADYWSDAHEHILNGANLRLPWDRPAEAHAAASEGGVGSDGHATQAVTHEQWNDQVGRLGAEIDGNKDIVIAGNCVDSILLWTNAWESAIEGLQTRLKLEPADPVGPGMAEAFVGWVQEKALEDLIDAAAGVAGPAGPMFVDLAKSVKGGSDKASEARSASRIDEFILRQRAVVDDYRENVAKFKDPFTKQAADWVLYAKAHPSDENAQDAYWAFSNSLAELETALSARIPGAPTRIQAELATAFVAESKHDESWWPFADDVPGYVEIFVGLTNDGDPTIHRAKLHGERAAQVIGILSDRFPDGIEVGALPMRRVFLSQSDWNPAHANIAEMYELSADGAYTQLIDGAGNWQGRIDTFRAAPAGWTTTKDVTAG